MATYGGHTISSINSELKKVRLERREVVDFLISHTGWTALHVQNDPQYSGSKQLKVVCKDNCFCTLRIVKSTTTWAVQDSKSDLRHGFPSLDAGDLAFFCDAQADPVTFAKKQRKKMRKQKTACQQTGGAASVESVSGAATTIAAGYKAKAGAGASSSSPSSRSRAAMTTGVGEVRKAVSNVRRGVKRPAEVVV